MRALLARRVDVAWLLLVTALSGGLLVLLLAVQGGSTPGGTVYIVQAAATTVAGQGGAPSLQTGDDTGAAPSRMSTVAVMGSPVGTTTPEPTTLSAAAGEVPVSSPVVPEQVTGSLIDINTATAAELETLPGIGPVLAGRIVRDREENGPFATVDELDRVEGIGGGIIAKLRAFVVAGP